MEYINILGGLTLGLSLFLTLVNICVLYQTIRISKEYIKLITEAKISTVKMIFETGNSIVSKIEEVLPCPKQQD
ncbi:MAG: hypothetical protein IJP48_07070 [Synergistaceae bacterium]|nr:hypothetical protein [Synergistaceae bacterium]